MRFEITSIRPKFRNLYLKSDIDPKDPKLDAKTAQTIFIHQNAKKFFDVVENKILKKILLDIDLILGKGWAKEISKNDFYHAHVCGKSKIPIFDVNNLLSVDNIALLYHTHESLPLTLDHINRNILSSLKFEPVVVHPKYKFDTAAKFPFYSVYPSDLDLKSYAKIHFTKNTKGSYKLNDGTRLDVSGVLYKDFYSYFQR